MYSYRLLMRVMNKPPMTNVLTLRIQPELLEEIRRRGQSDAHMAGPMIAQGHQCPNSLHARST